jgi:hypothetical protein
MNDFLPNSELSNISLPFDQKYDYATGLTASETDRLLLNYNLRANFAVNAHLDYAQQDTLRKKATTIAQLAGVVLTYAYQWGPSTAFSSYAVFYTIGHSEGVAKIALPYIAGAVSFGLSQVPSGLNAANLTHKASGSIKAAAKLYPKSTKAMNEYWSEDHGFIKTGNAVLAQSTQNGVFAEALRPEDLSLKQRYKNALYYAASGSNNLGIIAAGVGTLSLFSSGTLAGKNKHSQAVADFYNLQVIANPERTTVYLLGAIMAATYGGAAFNLIKEALAGRRNNDIKKASHYSEAS